MAIKATLTTLDGVDGALHDLYVQKDGVYVLDVEGIDTHPELAPLKNAYERQKADNATLRQERDTARADLTNATKGKPDEAALVAERQAYEARIGDLTGKLAAAEDKLTGVTRDAAFKAALADAGVTDPLYIDLLTAKHAAEVKLADGKAVVETGMGPKDVAAWAREQAAGAWSKLVTPPSGGGARGSEATGDKPLSQMGDAERLELARQGKLRAAAP